VLQGYKRYVEVVIRLEEIVRQKGWQRVHFEGFSERKEKYLWQRD
jgi:hypothetical protein